MSTRLLSTLLLATAVSVTTAASATAMPPSAAGTVAECTQHADRLLVDVAIDSSSSLQSSDPEDRRVDGVSAALLGLAGLVERPGWEQPPQGEVLLSSFAGSVQPSHPATAWRLITKDSIKGLLSQARRYGARDHGRDTDYVLALEAARSALNRRAATVAADGEAAPCKVILFLSDGGYHLGDRSGAAHLPSTVPYAQGVNLDRAGGAEKAMAIGRQLLCRRNGLMDQIESDGTVLFTVGLRGSKFSAEDRDRLAAMTVGASGEARCGANLSERTGQFIEARDSSELFFIFSNLLEPEPGPGSCLELCPNPSQFRTEAGMRGFVLAASAPRPGVELKLTDPAGESRSFSSTGGESVSFGGAEIQQHWINGRALRLQADFDPRDQAWLGTWHFQFYAPGETPVPVYELTFLSGLRPAIGKAPPLVPGATAKMPVHLVDQLGEPASEGLARSARLRVAVVDGSGDSRVADVHATDPGRFQVRFKVPAEAGEGSWKLRAQTYFPDQGTRVKGSSAWLDLGEAEAPKSPSPPWVLIAVAALLILLVVLLLEYRHRLVRARFVGAGQLRVFLTDVVVSPGAGVRLESDPGRLNYNDSEHRRPQDSEALDPFLFEVHVPWRFRGRPVAEASAGDRLLLGGTVDGELTTTDDHRRCRMPLDLAGTWLFAFEPSRGGQEVQGRLAVFTEQHSPAGLASALLEAAKTALREQDWEAFRDWPGAGNGEDSLDIDGIDWESIRKEHYRAQ